MLLLERDVVVGRGREVGALLLRRARGHELVAAVAVTAAAEELDGVGDDLDGLPLARAVGRIPLTPVEPAIDADRATLREVLRAALGLVAEDGDVEVIRLVDPGARFVAAAAVHCHPKAANRRTAGGVPQLGVLRQVAYENDAVDICHVLLLFPWILRPGDAGCAGGASSLAGLLFRASVLRVVVFRNGRFGHRRFGGFRDGAIVIRDGSRSGHGDRGRRVVARRARAGAGDVARRKVP